MKNMAAIMIFQIGKFRKQALWMLMLGVSFALVTASASAAENLTLDRAVEMALENNLKVKIAQTEIDEFSAKKKSVRGQFGPKVNVLTTIMWWDDTWELDVMDYVDLDTRVQRLLDMFVAIDPLTLREQETRTLTVSATQPITPLFQVYQGYQAGRHGELAKTDMYTRTRREIVHKTIKGYLLTLQAQEMLKVAQTAQTTIEAHVEQAKHFYEADFIGQNDILRAQVELANIRQLVIKAKSGVALAKAALAQTLGLPVEQDLALSPVTPLLMANQAPALEDARQIALMQRKDFSALNHKEAATKAMAKLAWWDMVPTVAAIGTYQYTDGIPPMDLEERFVGLMLSWDVWDWGKNYYHGKEASAQAKRIALEKRETAELIQLQVQKCMREWESARERLAVSEKSVAQAKENLRTQQLRFAENISSSVDVLDAQALLSKAEGNRIGARYELMTYASALRLALGEDLLEKTIESKQGKENTSLPEME